MPANGYASQVILSRCTRLHAIALVSLLAALLIYVVARPYSPISLGSFGTIATISSVPSFLHTLAFGLLIGSLARCHRQALSLVLIWGAVAIGGEVLQMLPAPDTVIAGFKLRWTFDRLDLFACVAGVLATLIILCSTEGRFDDTT